MANPWEMNWGSAPQQETQQQSSIQPSQAFSQNANIDVFNKLPEHIKPMVNSLAEGRIPLAGRSPLSKPAMTQLFEIASSVDPSLDATTFANRQKAATDFGPGGTTGKKMQSIGAVVQHLQNYERDYNKLNNNNILGGAENWVANKIMPLVPFVGPKYQAAKAGAQIDINAAAGELANAFRSGGGMSRADIEEWKNSFSPNDTPAETKAKLESAADLLVMKMQPQVDSYNQAMGTQKTVKDFLAPGAQQVFERIYSGGALQPAPLSKSPYQPAKTPGQKMGNALQTKIPQGITPQEWAAMSPQDKALWTK
jgi:hypothetical protein